MGATGKKLICGLLLFFICFKSVSLKSVETTTTKAEELTPNRDKGGKPEIASRFFGLENIFGSLFGSNQRPPGNNVFQPAFAIQGPLDQQGGWNNQGWNNQGRNPNQAWQQGNDHGRYPNQGDFQNFDLGQNQGGFGNQNQGPSFGQQQIPNQGTFFNQGGFGNNQNQGHNMGQQQYPNQGTDRFPNQGGFGNQEQNVAQQQFPNQGLIQNPDQGDFVNPDELPNQVNLQDQGTMYDPEDQQQGQFGNQNPSLNQGQWPAQTQNQGIQRPNQRPNWLDIGQGKYPLNEAGLNVPSQSVGNQETQTDDFSPVTFENNGQSGQGMNNFPAAVGGESGGSASLNSDNNLANGTQGSTTLSPILTQCVQDCSSTSEYSPICGSNNITYFNGGKFACARNCGLDISIVGRGRCQGDYLRRGLRDKIKILNSRRRRSV